MPRASFVDDATVIRDKPIPPLLEAEQGEMWRAVYRGKRVLFRIPEDGDLLMRIKDGGVEMVYRAWWESRATNWTRLTDMDGNVE